jgi:hypothetical protein
MMLAPAGDIYDEKCKAPGKIIASLTDTIGQIDRDRNSAPTRKLPNSKAQAALTRRKTSPIPNFDMTCMIGGVRFSGRPELPQARFREICIQQSAPVKNGFEFLSGPGSAL